MPVVYRVMIYLSPLMKFPPTLVVRYVPVGLLEVIPQQMNHRPPLHMVGRSDLETLMLSKNCADWIKISTMLLGPVPDGFQFEPKHKANSYQ
jgi:tRNA-dihydrouridine synthase 3